VRPCVCIQPVPSSLRSLLSFRTAALSTHLSVECWVWPNSFPNNAPAIVKADPSYRAGFGLVAIDEPTARKYVAIDKEKVKEPGQAKERNPWENGLADAELLPTMAFFVCGMKKESSALMRVPTDQWSHLAATFDGKTLVTYVNGRRADLFVLDPPLEEPPTHTQGDLSVGGVSGKYGFDGRINSVRVWSKALSWEDVRANMNDTLLGVDYREMVGQWSCNEGAGEIVYDSSRYANHGMIEGDVERVMCGRNRIEPAKTVSEQHVEESFERLRKWRLEFEKRANREVTKGDLMLADESIRRTAKRLGLL